jgi:CPA1 family monovalent cation:H+ antiporter
LQANQSALERLNEIATDGASKPDILQRLQVEYQERIQVLTEVCSRELGRGPHVLFSPDYDQLAREALEVERATILRLRNERVINDEVHRNIQHDIDLAEARLGHREAA